MCDCCSIFYTSCYWHAYQHKVSLLSQLMNQHMNYCAKWSKSNQVSLPFLLPVDSSRSLLALIAFCSYLTTIYWLPLFPMPSCTCLYESQGGIAAGEMKKEISFVFPFFNQIKFISQASKGAWLLQWAGTLQTSNVIRYLSLLWKMPPAFSPKNLSMNSPAPAE